MTVPVVRWYVLDAETTDLVAIHTDGNEQLSVMRFSRGELDPDRQEPAAWTIRSPTILLFCLQMVPCWRSDLTTTSSTCTTSPTTDANTADTGSAQ